jgi:hypothetical protein
MQKIEFSFGYGDLKDTLVSCEIPFDKKPTQKQVLKAFQRGKDRYKKGCEFNVAEFKYCTVFYSVRGWTGQWIAYLDNDNKYANNPHPSEPTESKVNRFSFNFK